MQAWLSNLAPLNQIAKEIKSHVIHLLPSQIFTLLNQSQKAEVVI